MTTPVFNVGDKVRVHQDYTYFTTAGIDMVVTEIIHEDVDGEDAVFYVTDHPCSIHGISYNDFELVALDS